MIPLFDICHRQHNSDGLGFFPAKSKDPDTGLPSSPWEKLFVFNNHPQKVPQNEQTDPLAGICGRYPQPDFCGDVSARLKSEWTDRSPPDATPWHRGNVGSGVLMCMGRKSGPPTPILARFIKMIPVLIESKKISLTPLETLFSQPSRSVSPFNFDRPQVI